MNEMEWDEMKWSGKEMIWSGMKMRWSGMKMKKKGIFLFFYFFGQYRASGVPDFRPVFSV